MWRNVRVSGARFAPRSNLPFEAFDPLLGVPPLLEFHSPSIAHQSVLEPLEFVSPPIDQPPNNGGRRKPGYVAADRAPKRRAAYAQILDDRLERHEIVVGLHWRAPGYGLS